MGVKIQTVYSADSAAELKDAVRQAFAHTVANPADQEVYVKLGATMKHVPLYKDQTPDQMMDEFREKTADEYRGGGGFRIV